MKRTRRGFARLLGAGLAAAMLPAPLRAGAAKSRAAARVVVVGGGFGGATAARYLKLGAPELEVTLIEPGDRFVTCPMSNAVLGGLRSMDSITHSYRHLGALGVKHVRALAEALDLDARQVVLAGGERLGWDRLILSPGIEFDYSSIDGSGIDGSGINVSGIDGSGVDRAGVDGAGVADRLPHAWKAGPQTELLARQLRAMRPGGLFVMSIPDNPYRCPPGPYERASLVAEYFRRHNPTAKILLLDAKDSFTKQALFEEAWTLRYPGMIERLSRADGARLTGVAADTRTFITEFDEFRADVGNLIPPQRAPALLRKAGLDQGRGWCEVHPGTFESRVATGVHIVGDAINANPMPKSAFAANNQAKACAGAVIAVLEGQAPPPALLVNTCYSLAGADYGISIAGVYRALGDQFAPMPGSVGTSPEGATGEVRAREARYAYEWYQAIVRDTFG